MAVIKNYMYSSSSMVARPQTKENTVSKAKSKVSASTLAFSIGIGLIIILLTIQSTQIFLLKSNIFNLEKELTMAQENYNKAMLEVTELKNPERILSIARSECDLELPGDEQFIAVYSNKK
jgi:cell division protein FtsL